MGIKNNDQDRVFSASQWLAQNRIDYKKMAHHATSVIYLWCDLKIVKVAVDLYKTDKLHTRKYIEKLKKNFILWLKMFDNEISERRTFLENKKKTNILEAKSNQPSLK